MTATGETVVLSGRTRIDVTDGREGRVIVTMPDGRRVAVNVDEVPVGRDAHEAFRVLLAHQYRELRDCRTRGRRALDILAWLHCPCGLRIGLEAAYRCLHCGLWFCKACAERHFGPAGAQRTGGR